MNNKNKIFNKGISTLTGIIILAVIALIAAGIMVFQQGRFLKEEIKISNVENPQKNATANWKTYKNEASDYEFRYPIELDAQYITTQKWPPEITIKPIKSNYVCEEFQNIKTSQGYASQKKTTLNNSDYCISVTSDPAAGIDYRTYKYITSRENQQLTIEFSLKFPSCGVFDKMEDCREEDKNFELTALVDQIISTLKFFK